MEHKALRLRRAYDPPEPEDGWRVLADRLWPRGLTRERAALHEWAREVSPSDALRREFGHQSDRFEAFRQAYLAELAGNPLAPAFREGIRKRLEGGSVTLLTAVKDVRLSHAGVLREWILRS